MGKRVSVLALALLLACAAAFAGSGPAYVGAATINSPVGAVPNDLHVTLDRPAVFLAATGDGAPAATSADDINWTITGITPSVEGDPNGPKSGGFLVIGSGLAIPQLMSFYWSVDGQLHQPIYFDLEPAPGSIGALSMLAQGSDPTPYTGLSVVSDGIQLAGPDAFGDFAPGSPLSWNLGLVHYQYTLFDSSNGVLLIGDVTNTPEPATFTLSLAVLGVGFFARRGRRRKR